MSAALAAIAFSVSSTVRSETERVSTDSDGLRTYYLASGSVERGIQWMLWGPDYRNPDGTPRFWAPNLPRMTMHYPSGDAVVEMIPETAKLNINYRRSGRAVPRGRGRQRRSRPRPRHRQRHYRLALARWPQLQGFTLGLSPTFQPRHASFEEIEELLLVRGMTPELYYGNFIADAEGRLFARGGLRDCLSVWGSRGTFRHQYRQPRADGGHRRSAGDCGQDRSTSLACGRSTTWAK